MAEKMLEELLEAGRGVEQALKDVKEQCTDIELVTLRNRVERIIRWMDLRQCVPVKLMSIEGLPPNKPVTSDKFKYVKNIPRLKDLLGTIRGNRLIVACLFRLLAGRLGLTARVVLLYEHACDSIEIAGEKELVDPQLDRFVERTGIYEEALEVSDEDMYLWILAEQCYTKREYGKAIGYYGNFRSKYPDFAEAYANRGLAYAGKGEYDIAIRDYDKAIRLNQRYAKAYVNLGLAYIGKREYDKAIEKCNTALRINPNFAEAYTTRGKAYAKKKNDRRARRDIARANKLET